MRAKADESILKVLRNCPLFTGLSGSDLKRLMRIAHIRDYSSEEQIFSEGNTGLCFYIIAKGSAEIVALSPSSKDGEIMKKTFTEGSYFSELHLFSESNHTVSCIAKELTRLIIFTKPDFEDLIKLKPKLGNKILLKFLEFLSEQLNTIYKENIQLLQKVPEASR
jgi:CRP-like cAMP-binding protein